MKSEFTEDQFKIVMDQIVTPLSGTVIDLKDTVKELKISFGDHVKQDEKNQAHIIQLITQAELLMDMNTKLQGIIANMPKDMERRFDILAKDRLEKTEKRIDVCREDEPARIATEVMRIVKKKTPLDIIMNAGTIVIICGAIIGGAMIYLTNQKDVARLEKEIQRYEGIVIPGHP